MKVVVITKDVVVPDPGEPDVTLKEGTVGLVLYREGNVALVKVNRSAYWVPVEALREDA